MEEFNKKKDLMEYIEEIRDENDINHLETLYNEAKEIVFTDKQKKWLNKEVAERKNILENMHFENEAKK
jgi:predicted nucleic acid-binding protein